MSDSRPRGASGDGGPPAWLARRRLGTTALLVTPLCIGGAPLGSMPENFGEEVGRERALETVRHVFDGPVNFLDTSNSYSTGESERRIGAVIAERVRSRDRQKWRVTVAHPGSCIGLWVGRRRTPNVPPGNSYLGPGQ